MSLSSFFPLRPWRSWRFVSLSTFFTTQIGLLYAQFIKSVLTQKGERSFYFYDPMVIT
ncbi:MAG: hypothetical protein V7K18_04480 [Nostoc sp.]|uniref:hypothetical protein n=1 Tax=Nostoc sp. TaxID=1180 RepID=UPI002FF719B2